MAGRVQKEVVEQRAQGWPEGTDSAQEALQRPTLCIRRQGSGGKCGAREARVAFSGEFHCLSYGSQPH